MYRLYRKMTINGHFFYIIYTFFVWIQLGCSDNIVFAFDPSNSVIKRLLCALIIRLYCTLVPKIGKIFLKSY